MTENTARLRRYMLPLNRPPIAWHIKPLKILPIPAPSVERETNVPRNSALFTVVVDPVPNGSAAIIGMRTTGSAT